MSEPAAGASSNINVAQISAFDTISDRGQPNSVTSGPITIPVTEANEVMKNTPVELLATVFQPRFHSLGWLTGRLRVAKFIEKAPGF